MAVEIAERQPAELLVDVPPQLDHRPLCHPGHDPALDPAEDRAEDVEGDEDREQAAEGAKVDPGRVQVEPGQPANRLLADKCNECKRLPDDQ